MGLNPEVWGPHYWFFLRTIAISYPLNPNEITKKKYYSFINDLPLFIPDARSATNFSDLLDKYPVKPYLDSRASLIKWVTFVHNKVNFALGKPEISEGEAMSRYNYAFKPPELKDTDTSAFREKMIFLAIIVSMVGFCIFAYKGGRVS